MVRLVKEKNKNMLTPVPLAGDRSVLGISVPDFVGFYHYQDERGHSFLVAPNMVVIGDVLLDVSTFVGVCIKDVYDRNNQKREAVHVRLAGDIVWDFYTDRYQLEAIQEAILTARCLAHQNQRG